MSRLLACLAALTVAAAACAAEKPRFVDPKPPTAVASTAGTAPAARPNADVTFHTAPRPLAKDAVTTDWPSFLGPTHNMFSAETKLRRDFPADGLKPVWEMKRGEGFAAPAILGDRLILFHRVGDQEVVDCLHPADGRRYWRFGYSSAYRDRYGYNHGPRASPVIGDDRVFTYGAEGKLHCLALETGELLWQRDILTEFGIEQNFFGVGATPLVEGRRLIVNVGAPDGPCVAAFDTRTGKLVWGAAADGWGASYASPIPAILHGKRRVLVFAGGESKPPTGGLVCLDPDNGEVDFTFPWRGTRYESVNAASPVVTGAAVFVTECYGSGGVLVDMLAGGRAAKRWSNPRFGMHFMTAVPLDGHLYGVDGHGPHDAEIACVELATGKEVWRTQPVWEERVPSSRGAREMKVGIFRGSFLQVDGRTLCLGEFGHLLWLELSPAGYRELARTWLFAATETWTPPVISRGLLYVCQNSRGALREEPPRLLCYDLRAE